MIRNVIPVMTKNATQDIRHEACTGVELYTVPDNRQSRAGTDEVVRSIHAEDASGDYGVADMVDRGAAGVEEHGN